MFGALLGVMAWILLFVVVGLGFFALFDPGVATLLELVVTLVQPPVVAVALLALYEGGIPGGIGELKDAVEWVQSHDPDEEVDYQELPANTVLVGLELAAVTLAGVGLVTSVFFSIMTTVSVVGAFGRPLMGPGRLSAAGLSPSESFGLFLAGTILWQVAMFAEASSLV